MNAELYPARLPLLLLLMFFGYASCRKREGPVSEQDRLKDEVLLLTRQNYLWHNQIPEKFDPRLYTDPAGVMQAIRQFSLEPGFSDPVDDFSFAMKKTEWENLSSGVSAGFGLEFFFFSGTDLRVTRVEKASAAGIAGIRRGWRVIKIDDDADIRATRSEAIRQKIRSAATLRISFEKPDLSTREITLTATIFQEYPLSLDTVYTLGDKKVGYLVLNSFLGNTSTVTAELNRVFSRFITAGITDCIIDLRYNGGGYVSLQSTLANFLVPPSANGSVMMNEVFNANNTGRNVTTRFEKLGNLHLPAIYCIVSDHTASASELLINNLIPYMDVVLIGEETYGKPVGFFPIPAGDWYIFPVSFRSTNGQDQGNYFNGFPVHRQVTDGLDRDWGDTEEARLSAALQHITTGNFGYLPAPEGLNSELHEPLREANRALSSSFIGAVH